MTPIPDRLDQIALAQYLSTLRASGPALVPRLAEAFEKLTPGQLDALIESTLERHDEASQTEQTPEPVPQQPTQPEAAPEKRRRWFQWTNDDWAWFWFWLALE
jgi:hypothetical protein